VLVAAICLIRPGHVETRLAARADHPAFIEAHAVKPGDAFRDGEGKPVGSRLVIDRAEL